MTKKLFQILTLSLIAGGTFAGASAQADKVGIISLSKALQECKKGKTAKAALQKEVDEKRKKIEAEQSSLQKANEDFQKKSAVMSEKARIQKGTELQQKIATFQQLVQKSQGDVQAREGEVTRPIIEGLRALIPDLAKKNKVSLVFEDSSSGLLYSEDKVDLTNDLIKAYDAKN